MLNLNVNINNRKLLMITDFKIINSNLIIQLQKKNIYKS